MVAYGKDINVRARPKQVDRDYMVQDQGDELASRPRHRIPHVAEVLDKSRSWVYVNVKPLGMIKVGSQWRISDNALAAYIQRCAGGQTV